MEKEKMKPCENCLALLDLENEGHIDDPEKGILCVNCADLVKDEPVKHDQTPWVAEPEEASDHWGIVICSPGGDVLVATINPLEHPADAWDWTNAAFIIKAANSHENLVKALEHAVAMMEDSIDRYGDPAKLFDLEHYRDVLHKAEAQAWENCLRYAPPRILKLLGLAEKTVA